MRAAALRKGVVRGSLTNYCLTLRSQRLLSPSTIILAYLDHNSIIARMMRRRLQPELARKPSSEAPAVALLGPRQVGKTTLALEIADTRPSIYLDLESEADRAKLTEPELYLEQHADKLVILDEIQRTPQAVPEPARPDRPGAGAAERARGASLFSALHPSTCSRQSSETLAGRIRYLELASLDAGEVDNDQLNALWLRGGFPESLLGDSDAASLRWRRDFIRTYLERDIPQLGPRIPAETLRRFWTMLAHQQGSLLNAAALARALAVERQDHRELPRSARRSATRAPAATLAR